MKRFLVGLLFALSLTATVAAQQEVAPNDPQQRAQVEQQFRQMLAQIVRQRLNLTDDQMRQLQATNQRFEGQRRSLVQQEREVLQGLRAEQLSATPNQDRVSTLIDKQLQIQQQRIAITREEQRELGGYLSPMQRAQYAALQEQIRRRLQEMRRQRMLDNGLKAPRDPEVRPLRPRSRRP